MNIYDFDGTIYNGDSTVDFYFFILKRHPAVVSHLPKQIFAALCFKSGKYSVTEFKENFFSFLIGISDVSSEVDLFWKKNIKKIMPWYYEKKKESDIIISASPEFLLAPVCKILGNISLIASETDMKTGKFTGENCKGQEKVKRFRKKYGNAVIDDFYSDSLSDLPLARIAKRAFLVKKGKIREWNTET